MNQDVLNALGKREAIEDTISTIKKMHKANRLVIRFCMIGFENDTIASIKNDIKKIAHLQLDITQLDILTPFPKTHYGMKSRRNMGFLIRIENIMMQSI